MNTDELLRQYHENRAAMAPHLADYHRRRDEDELRQMRRDAQVFAQQFRSDAETAPAPDDWGHVDHFAAHRTQYAVDWSAGSAPVQRAATRKYGPDTVVRVCDSAFSVR